MLMNKSITVDDFEDTVKTWPAMFHFNIRPLSTKSVIRTYDGKLSVTVLLKNVAVIPQLEYAGPGAELEAGSLVDNIDEEIRDSENAETFHITLPQEGNYYFTLLANIFEEEIDVPVFQFRIEYVDELLWDCLFTNSQTCLYLAFTRVNMDANKETCDVWYGL